MKIKIEQGKLRAKLISDGKVRAFLGIPYAAPPLGDLRWRAPEPAARWKGERDATKYGAHCVQTPFEDMSFQDAGASEDCLYLNVFTPADAKGSSKLPVMFWIHGGGYFSGSASEPRHNGDFLPGKGVVLVTINYRLGVFGFLATKELMQEGGGSAGNYGLMDMIAALQWVKTNIAKFGGDAQNVTIFGESAGSFAVSTLMASPMAQGLFQKAIGESGAAQGEGLGGRAAAQEAPAGDEWAQSLGAKSLAALRSIPAETLLQASHKSGAPRFSPVVDGKVLTEPVAATYAAGKQAHVPLLAGWNRDEGNMQAAKAMTVAQWQSQAAANFGDRAAEFLELYPGTDDAQAARSSIDYSGDTFIAFGTWKWIEAQVKTGEAPVYRYHFELVAPVSKFDPDAAAFHSDDIEYVFGALDTRPGAVWRDEDRKLSELMMDYWTNFAKTGDPNGPGLPAWPRYDKTGAVMHLDRETHASPDTTRARYEFLLGEMPAGRP
ncbi:MAG: carboxylesterase family protein [Terracidiphilus sp.]|nr:carboxylesterase family protein [Terracidiphilus sp.]